MRHRRVRVTVSFAGRWRILKCSRLFQRIRTGAAPLQNRTRHYRTEGGFKSAVIDA